MKLIAALMFAALVFGVVPLFAQEASPTPVESSDFDAASRFIFNGAVGKVMKLPDDPSPIIKQP